MIVRYAVAVVLLLPLVLAGCRSGGERRYAELEPPRQALDGLGNRRCVYVGEPQVPQSLDALTRPGTRGAMLLWATDATPADSVELSVRYGNDGRLSWVRILRSSVPSERAYELARMVETGLLADGPADWGVRLRVIEGRVASVLPGVICEAEQRGRTGRVLPPLATSQDLVEARQARGRPIDLAVSLDESGRVTGVRLTGGSGSRYWDQYAIEVARAGRYEPKLHDGMGVPATVPVRLQVPRR